MLAQPDSRWYRARKFVRRNLLAVSASAAIVLAVIAGAGVATWQARVAQGRATPRGGSEGLHHQHLLARRAPTAAGTTSLSAVDLLKQARRAPGAVDIAKTRRCASSYPR